MEEFYALELSVEPGGARKHVMHILAKLEHVYDELQKDLIRDAGLAIGYGEEILLHRCQLNNSSGVAIVIETIDLHTRITFHVGDFAPIKFDADQKVIGYHKSEFYAPISEESPIDFTSKDIQEVYRYLNYDINEIFRMIRASGQNGSNMERYPPNVGVQIDLTRIPRIENPIRRWRHHKIRFEQDGEIRDVKPGLNDFGG